MIHGNPFDDVKDDLAGFFRGLGYVVTWDYDARGRWYEFLDAEGLVCQLDDKATLDAFLEDLPELIEGRSGTSSVSYEIRCPTKNMGRFRVLAERAIAARGLPPKRGARYER